MFVPQKAGIVSLYAVFLFVALGFSFPAGSEEGISLRHNLLNRDDNPSPSTEPASTAPTGVCTVEEQAPIECTYEKIWKSCVDGYTGPWQSAQNGALFPTVNDIKTDMQRCGNVGQTGPTIFYSFGAKTPEARGFRDQLNPPGNMFNDALPGDWFGSVNNAVNLVAAGRQDLLVARYGQAMAELSNGEIFLVVPPDKSPYTNPLPGGPPNVWRRYEFPTLQRNSAITKVTKVVNANPYDRETGWLPNDSNYPELPASDADSQPVPPVGGLPPPVLPPTLPPIPSLPPITLAATPTTSAPAPTGTTCDCNEDGCTPESPPCCANGTCTTPAPAPTGTTCNCNEDGCTPESPPCCANGTC